MKALVRFWSKVSKGAPNACWLWTGTKNNHGYGMFQLQDEEGRNGKRLAHRVSYAVHYGPIPDGAIVMHACDNPACVNPGHLRLGTMKLNTQDMMTKGRHRYETLRGDDHPMRKNPSLGKRGGEILAQRSPDKVAKGEAIGTSKLTEDDVREIYRLRLSGVAQRAIARQFGVDKSTIQDICHGERWGHLLGTQGCPTLDHLLSLPKVTPKTKLQ